MIYLLLAIASSALISIIMRISERYVRNEMGMFMANYAICAVLSFLYMGDKTILFRVSGQWDFVTLMLGIISGVLYLVSFVFMKQNMKRNGIVMTSTFMKLGVLVPTLMAIVVFGEIPGATQLIGFLFAVGGILVMYLEKETVHFSGNKFMLLLLLFLSGLTDSMANIFEKVGQVDYKDIYLLITFGAALLLACIFMLRAKERVRGKDLLVGVLIGIPNYFSARFLLLSLGQLQAVLVYPMYSVTTILVTTLAGIVLFGESVSRKKICALGMVALAMVLLNV